ncbi:MAG: glycosyltransferase [Elusimicrobia bacterium]|nr:glycosyltransferase [Elusimicrobiota bacterium]
MISIIIPIYNEAPNIKPLFEELKNVLGKLEMPWEIIWVDDGSSDDCDVEVKKLGPGAGKITYIKLTKNFGQSAALACGIEHASGEIIVTMDGDGQNDPAEIPALLAKLKEGYGVVCGWRRKRHDYGLRVWTSHIANWIVSRVTNVLLHDYGCTLRAYQSRPLKQLQIMGDMHRLLPAYLAWTGLKITELPVRHRPRTIGRSKYSIAARAWKVVLDAFLLNFYFSYITRPMHFFGFMGLILIGSTFTVECFVILRRLVFGGAWLSPLFFLGLFFACAAIMFLFLGIIADLMARSFMFSQNIKTYHIAKKMNIECGI